MTGPIDADLFAFFHLDHPAVLHDKGYGAEADRLQRITQHPLQLLAPWIRVAMRHIPVPSSAYKPPARLTPRLKTTMLMPSGVRSNSKDSLCSYASSATACSCPKSLKRNKTRLPLL